MNHLERLTERLKLIEATERLDLLLGHTVLAICLFVMFALIVTA